MCSKRERLTIVVGSNFDSLFMTDNVLYCYPVGGVGNEKGYPRTSRIILPSVLVDSAIKLSNDHLLIGGHMSA
jgi:hypothetical protein